MAEILLSAFIEVLFDRLASPGFLNFVRQLVGEFDSELKQWQDTLRMIQAVLGDADEKQLTDKAVKNWLDDLRDLAYDSEDILDEFSTKALERRLMAQHDHDASSSKVHRLIPSCFSCFNPNTAKFNDSMRSRIKEITGRLDRLCKQRNDLGLQLSPGGASSTTPAQRRPPSSSVPNEPTVFGRDQDKAKILDRVLTYNPSDHAHVAVIPIVGMAGVGKTTLAREVYNDKAVEDSKFDIKAWVCVSDVFDVLSISRALLESITSNTCDLKAVNEVQLQLQKAVDGKKILLVLDDVWNEDYVLWEDLKAPFLAAAPNSKIVVTTRHSRVASTMERTPHYKLQCLSDEDCWSLFMMHASVSQDQITNQLRDKVVGKCGGLPLAAKTLAGLLRSNEHEAWNEILNSNILKLPQQSGIHPVLNLSYHYLSSHLKRCFAYCAIFPKDYELEKNELVFLWMAEGIIQQSEVDKQPEELGRECFQDLVSRSIFEKSSGDDSKFVMHDLVHDLALLVSRETIFKLEEANKSSRRFERVRHFSYNRGIFDVKDNFKVLHDVEHLRTFLPTHISGSVSFITSKFLYELLPKFKKLRVLSLESYCITELPNSIGGLKLLRYLNLACTTVTSLPESINSLLNLQFLILRYCYCLIKLPAKMRNLINLRHLDIEGAASLKEMPLGMKELKNLQLLSNFIVGKGDTVSELKDLKNLKFLGGKICISGLENVKNSEDARDTALWEKQSLEAVSLQWTSQLVIRRNEVEEEHVLDMLRPHKNIKVLSIKHYAGARFPQWIRDPSFSKMESLTLENCENCTFLPSLGLLGSLKHLIIRGMGKLKSIGSEFYGNGFLKPFQSLEILRFENLQECERWDTDVEESGILAEFSSLRELFIIRCPKLSRKLPERLPSLETLVVRECAELEVSFSSFPMLCKFGIDRCKGLVCGTSPIDSKLIESVTVSNSSLDIYGCKGMIYNDCTAAKSRLQPNSVTITNTLEFGKLLKRGFQQVETLCIGVSQHSMSWESRGMPQLGVHLLTFPKEVSIEESCLTLVRFPEINICPNNLRSLKIGQCSVLKFLPEEIVGNNSQLESLEVINCDSLTSIGRRKLPSSLKSLVIQSCKILRHLVDGEEDASSFSSSSATLKRLSVYNCPELTSLSSGIQLLEALENLHVNKCPKLESIPDGLHNLNRLVNISLLECPRLVSFGERGLPNTISTIRIMRCEKLQALPNEMHKFSSLRELIIDGCEGIMSFPEGGFPTNLTSLTIKNVKFYKALTQWGLHRLTSLKSLWISGCDEAECFPDEEMGMMLPTSLSFLYLLRFSKLKSLSSRGFQSLTSLRLLWIDDCPKLTSFPEVGLPSSLGSLDIEKCPKLEKECKRDKGKEWSKIAHIPCVHINKKFMYDQE